MNDPHGIADVFKAHYSKLAACSNNPFFLEQHRIHIEADVRDSQRDKKVVFQPELDGEFIVEEMKASIDHLPTHTSVDSKDVVCEYIRNGGSDFQRLLLSFVNLLWDQEGVPRHWGTGIFATFYKAGDSTDAGNCKGIALICMIWKLFSNG